MTGEQVTAALQKQQQKTKISDWWVSDCSFK